MTRKKLNLTVLDHGYVKEKAYMGTEELIVQAARMSTGKGFKGWEKDEKFLDFLWRNKHTSPFESCELMVEVQAPIFVAREWMRHRTFSYNEFSARYAQMPNLHYLPDESRIQSQDQVNKQGSAGELSQVLREVVRASMKGTQDWIYTGYQSYLKDDIAREIARINTPVSRYTRFTCKGNLKNWLHFLELRMASDAQWEIRQYANAVGSIIASHWPRVHHLFMNHTFDAVTFSGDEIEFLRANYQAIKDFIDGHGPIPFPKSWSNAKNTGFLKKVMTKE